jgi:hypothetical protein
MSVASSVALSQAPATRLAKATGNGRLRLLFAVILVTSLSAVALSVVSYAKPIGNGDGLPDYASIAGARGYLWGFFVVAGVQLIVGACAAALAAWLLAPRRGARWANVGGSFVWLGAAIYGVGIGGWATVYYFATDPATLDPSVAARLIDHVNDDTARMLAVPIGGALLVALGSILLAVALWRARTVPRWVPIVGALTAVTGIVLPPDTIVGIIAEAASSATTVAVGWYAWRRGPVETDDARIYARGSSRA